MQHLFIARHGSYDSSSFTHEQLTPRGMAQYVALADLMLPIVANGNIGIVSSPYPRAVQSAQLLARLLGVAEIEQEFKLGCCDGGRHPEKLETDLRTLFELTTEREALDSLVFVTHLEAAKFLPAYIMEKRQMPISEVRKIGRGEAVHLDFTKRGYAVLTSAHAEFL